MEPTATLTSTQAAARIGISRGTFLRWARDGRIPYARVGISDRAPMRFAPTDVDTAALTYGYATPDTGSPTVTTPAGDPEQPPTPAAKPAPRKSTPLRTNRKRPSRTTTAT